jgi:hypothetical protein
MHLKMLVYIFIEWRHQNIANYEKVNFLMPNKDTVPPKVLSNFSMTAADKTIICHRVYSNTEIPNTFRSNQIL